MHTSIKDKRHTTQHRSSCKYLHFLNRSLMKCGTSSLWHIITHISCVMSALNEAIVDFSTSHNYKGHLCGMVVDGTSSNWPLITYGLFRVWFCLKAQTACPTECLSVEICQMGCGGYRQPSTWRQGALHKCQDFYVNLTNRIIVPASSANQGSNRRIFVISMISPLFEAQD